MAKEDSPTVKEVSSMAKETHLTVEKMAKTSPKASKCLKSGVFYAI